MNRLSTDPNRTLLVSIYPYVFFGAGLTALLFFWVITPICIMRAPLVRFPSAPHAEPFPETEGQVAVTLTAGGDTFLDLRRVSRPELKAYASRLVAARRHPPFLFLVRADARLSFGDVRLAIAALHEGGVTSVRLVTQD